MNLLLVKPEQISADGVFTATPEQSLHIAGVLHGKAGDRIKVGVQNGNIGEAELLTPDKRKAMLKILHLDKVPPTKKKLRFLIALPRPQSFKKCLHFLASAGIPEATFIQTARVEKSYWNSAAMTSEAIADEVFLGLEQGVDTVPPKLNFFRSFREWKKTADTISGRRLIAHPFQAVPCPASLPNEEIFAAIGPEGGFLMDEVNAFKELGFECVELGSYILRVEFALAYMAGRLS